MNYSRNITRPITALLLGLFLFALTANFTGCKDKSGGRKMPAPKVMVTSVKFEEVNKYKEYVGQVTSVMKEVLEARVQGYLVKKNFVEGAFVKKDELLFVIQQDQYKAQVEIEKGNLLKAQAQQKNAEIEYERFKYLSGTQAVSQKTFDFAEAAKGSAEGDVAVAKGNLSLAELNLSYTEIHSPCDGKIGKVTYDVGNLVGPKNGNLATVYMYDPIYVEFNVNEASLVQYLSDKSYQVQLAKGSDVGTSIPGVRVALKLADGSNYKIYGEICFIDNKISPTTGTVLFRGLFKNPNRILVPGEFVTVKLEKVKKDKILVVPQTSFLQDQLGPYVYVVNKDKVVQQRHVKLGNFYGTVTEVKNGLKEGDIVITQGLQKIRPGVKVIPVKTEQELKENKPESKEKNTKKAKAKNDK